MSLKIILPLKKINVNGKEVTIPKLGLKHHALLNKVSSPEEHIKALIGSIRKDLTFAEANFVLLHVLEFNGKIKDSVTKDGFTYRISDAYICQRLEHQYSGNTFYFRSPEQDEKFTTPDDVLAKCFIRVNDSDVVPDFLSLPAFVYSWADDIVTSVAIKGPYGPVKGLSKILELFE